MSDFFYIVAFLYPFPKPYMKTQIIILLLSSLSLFCCKTTGEHKADARLREAISGDWEEIIEGDDLPVPFFISPEGMSIHSDSIEFYTGFYKDDETTGKRTSRHLTNFVPYKTNEGKIIIKDPISGKWRAKWKFIGKKNDTLQLAVNDSTIVRYRKILNKPDILSDFDQIIYSSSGCYGTCPIIDISVSKQGSILFQGEGYAKPLGFYSGRIDAGMKDYIFDKFRRANPLRLKDYYAADHTDDESLTTTFIQSGKIVKTIHDYGKKATNELIWAYVPISTVHDHIKLDSLPPDQPYYPKLRYFAFEKNGRLLELEKSESFFLWTELIKSKHTNKTFKPRYKVSFTGNYAYWGPDPNKKAYQHSIKSISTDGQFFTFEFSDRQPATTYDLGYNFVDRNFKPADFRRRSD